MQHDLWNDVTAKEFDDWKWQEKHASIKIQDIEQLVGHRTSRSVIRDLSHGTHISGMSVRITPYLMTLIDWDDFAGDPIRRQFLPLASEMEPDHPLLSRDSLSEQDDSPVPGLVHRYPTKVLLLATQACPVYCQFCTRSYAVGLDTPVVRKERPVRRSNHDQMMSYLRAHPEIEDVVVSGGDVARLTADHIRSLGIELLSIAHVRRIRLATKALAVLPMKFTSDDEWYGAIADMASFARRHFKEVFIHTHINHPREVTPHTREAMRRLHGDGIYVRNQTVLLRGVNDSSDVLTRLIRDLGQIHIHPYYVYMCDMVAGVEHFRLPLHVAQRLETAVRGSTSGFDTPLFVVDSPGGKRDVHSPERYDREMGLAYFEAPAIKPGRVFPYADPLRSLSHDARRRWAGMQGGPGARSPRAATEEFGLVA